MKIVSFHYPASLIFKNHKYEMIYHLYANQSGVIFQFKEFTYCESVRLGGFLRREQVLDSDYNRNFLNYNVSEEVEDLCQKFFLKYTFSSELIHEEAMHGKDGKDVKRQYDYIMQIVISNPLQVLQAFGITQDKINRIKSSPFIDTAIHHARNLVDDQLSNKGELSKTETFKFAHCWTKFELYFCYRTVWLDYNHEGFVNPTETDAVIILYQVRTAFIEAFFNDKRFSSILIDDNIWQNDYGMNLHLDLQIANPNNGLKTW